MKTTDPSRAGLGLLLVASARALRSARLPRAAGAGAHRRPGRLRRAAAGRHRASWATSTTRRDQRRRARFAARRSQAAPALLRAVDEHADGYVRYRALVLLTGFNDPRTAEAMREALSSPNDRLRTVAYTFFEHNPDPDGHPAADRRRRQGTGRVRPAGARARLASARAHRREGSAGARDATSAAGEDFFRGAVIEALGDYKAQYAVPAILARSPSSTDRCRTMRCWRSGRSATSRTLETLAALQRSAPRNRQPSIAAAHLSARRQLRVPRELPVETLKFTDTQPGIPGAAQERRFGLGALGVSGRPTAVEALFDVGIPSQDPDRAPVALALATRGAPQHAADAARSWRPHPRRDEALLALRRGVRHARRGPREGAVLCVRPPRRTGSRPKGRPRARCFQTVIGKLDF